MSKPLPKKLRAKWNALIATEGAALGLTDCRVFLENKMVNDIFYEGLFRGRPCVVKCSSRAPDSILNEYEMSKRLFAEAPVCAEPLAHYRSPDGKLAFVVTEKLPNGMLPTDPAADILRMAQALAATGIVHRDISVNNLLVGGDGHLKLIDFQFAVDRNDHHESSYMLAHPTYLYFKFGNCEELGLGRWNDLLGFGLCACLQNLAPDAGDELRQMENMVPDMMFSVRVTPLIRVLLHLELFKLRVQLAFNHKLAFRWRVKKLSQLLQIGAEVHRHAANEESGT